MSALELELIVLPPIIFEPVTGITQGPAATIEVGDVTTGLPGTDVIIDNVGDEHDAIFDFTIPRGANGANGTNGANGAPGPNLVSTATDTDITGVIKGTGTKIAAAGQSDIEALLTGEISTHTHAGSGMDETAHDLLDHTGLTGIHASGSDAETASTIATIINGVAETTILDADEVPFYKSSGGLLKKNLWSAIKALFEPAIVQRSFIVKVIDDATVLATGDNQYIFRVPVEVTGWNLSTVLCSVTTVSSSGAPAFTLYNLTDSVDMMSVAVGIPQSAFVSTSGTVNVSYDDVVTNDRIACNCDTAGTNARGWEIKLTFVKP
jgi:hypothetical protein